MLLEPRGPRESHSARALRYWRARNGLWCGGGWALVTALVAYAFVILDLDGVVVVAGAAALVLLILLVGLVGVAPIFELRFRRYELTAEGVFVQAGFLVRERILVPYARIQSVKTRKGPIERHFELASVVLQTSAHGVVVSVLDDEVAMALRDRVSVLARESSDDL